MKLFAAILILCTSATAADGPVFGIWHMDGHGYQWQRDQQDAGLPMELCIRLPHPQQINGKFFLNQLETDAPVLATFDGQSIQLRCHNLTDYVEYLTPRIPKDELPERWQESHVSIHLKDGKFEDTPIPTPWATSDEPWRIVGRRWAQSAWLKRLQEIIPNPTGIILRENNEGAILTFEQMNIGGVVKWFDENNGYIRWAKPTTPKDIWIMPDSSAWDETAGWHLFVKPNDEKQYAVRWKTDAELDGVDLRAKDWVATRRHLLPTPEENAADLRKLYTPFYHAIYEELQAGFGEPWASVPFRTVGYGGPAENYANDASSSTFYMARFRDPALTAPVHQTDLLRWRAENWSNPNGWAELSVRMSGKSVFDGAQRGLHDVVDPESYSGLMTYVLWMMQSPEREVRLTYYESNSTPPTDPTLTGTWPQIVRDLGRDDLVDVTAEDWEIAVMERMQFIHSHPVVNRYWREGTTTVLDSPQNDAKADRVYAMATEIPGEKRRLLFVYTPCTLESIVAGSYTLTGQRAAYYLTEPLEPLPDVVPDELTTDERVERLERDVSKIKKHLGIE